MPKDSEDGRIGADRGWGEIDRVEQRYAPLVSRLERLAARNLPAYRRRVIAAGLLGYLVLGGALVFALLLFVPLVVLALTIALPLGLGVRLVIAAAVMALLVWLIFRLSHPRGRGFPVTAAQLPALFALIERLRVALAAPKLDEVRLYGDINAGLGREPRGAGRGWRTVLRIGLPLFYALDETELTAILAHELAHLSNRHSTSLLFINGVRARWSQFGRRVSDGLIARLLRRFFAWYGPWLLAYSAVLIRHHEYEADRTAAGVVGAAAMAAAQRRVAVKVTSFDRIVNSRPVRQAQLIGSDLLAWRVALPALTKDGADDAAILRWRLGQQTELSDTHPALFQRLLALGERPLAGMEPMGSPAAATLLGDQAGFLIEQIANPDHR